MIYEHMPGGTSINLKSANEQVPDIERQTRVIKGRKRFSDTVLPLTKIPNGLSDLDGSP